ncbi:flagellar basal body rod protein FlgB [Vibrio parahaemolyticus]|nr:flagellar basal body rod protein FlgB [Vibrio parahaemolyticus]
MFNENVLGVHPQLLQFRAQRAEVLASNIANVDTPNYKARELTFEHVLSGVMGQSIDIGVTEKYRIPMQKSRDGNTVELYSEQARFAENTQRYNQSMQFMKSKIKGLQKAIEGR